MEKIFGTFKKDEIRYAQKEYKDIFGEKTFGGRYIIFAGNSPVYYTKKGEQYNFILSFDGYNSFKTFTKFETIWARILFSGFKGKKYVFFGDIKKYNDIMYEIIDLLSVSDVKTYVLNFIGKDDMNSVNVNYEKKFDTFYSDLI